MRGEGNFRPDIGAEPPSRGIDEAIAALADRQHGVVARRQLSALGLGRRGLGHRLERGRLHPLHRGVYAVGHRVLSPAARWMAAVLAAGPDGALSHRSAAALWGILATARRQVEVSAPRRLRHRPGVRFHRCVVAGDERTVERWIPVTTVPRTLLDLAAVASRRELERAFEQAEVLRLVDDLSVADLLERRRGHRGAVAIRAVLTDRRLSSGVTRSELEERFLQLLEAAALPRPELNKPLQLSGRWIEPDCMWPAERLIVELDGRASHATTGAFERDRLRDRLLQAAGWRVVRITWRQLHEAPSAVASDLRALLTG